MEEKNVGSFFRERFLDYYHQLSLSQFYLVRAIRSAFDDGTSLPDCSKVLDARLNLFVFWTKDMKRGDYVWST